MKLLVIVACAAVASAGVLEPGFGSLGTEPLKEASSLARGVVSNSFKFTATVFSDVEGTSTVLGTCFVLEGDMGCPRRLRRHHPTTVPDAPMAVTQVPQSLHAPRSLDASLESADMIHISAPARVWKRVLNLDLLVVTETYYRTTSTTTVTSYNTFSLAYSGCSEPVFSPTIQYCTVTGT